MEKGLEQGARSCELLQEELSAINQVANRSPSNLLAGFTCRMLEAEVCSVASWDEVVGRMQSHASSPRKDRELHTAGSEHSRSESQFNGDFTRCAAKHTAEREVERLSQVIQTYESQVVPHLMVERALLNCELAKARKAAVTSAEDCQALRGRVLEVEAESSFLRNELDAFRAGRRGGG
jgi:hypothetical protein